MAVGVQMGVVYLAVSSVLFELSSRSSGFSSLLVPCVVSSTGFCLQLHFRGSGVFPDDWAMVLAATVGASCLLVIIFFVALRDLLGSCKRHRSVLCRLFSTDCLCFGCDAPRLFWDFMFPQFGRVLATLW